MQLQQQQESKRNRFLTFIHKNFKNKKGSKQTMQHVYVCDNENIYIHIYVCKCVCPLKANNKIVLFKQHNENSRRRLRCRRMYVYSAKDICMYVYLL